MSDFSEREQGQKLARDIHRLFIEKNKTLTVAESLTGGLISTWLSAWPGASRFFVGSVVCYSYEAKIKTLKVPARLLEDKGAVCEEVARQMARGLLNQWSADIGLAVTGVAGPALGPKDPPVGQGFVALATLDPSASSLPPASRQEARAVLVPCLRPFDFGIHQGREEIRYKSATAALSLLKDFISGQK